MLESVYTYTFTYAYTYTYTYTITCTCISIYDVYIYICEQIDPCSGCIKASRIDCEVPMRFCLSSVSTMANSRGAPDCFARWALEPTRRWQSSPLKLDLGVSYSVAPYSSHSHPPCPMLYVCTGHEGWELN